MSDLQNTRLFFDRGTVCIKNSGLLRIPNTKLDDRDKNTFRAYGLYYKEIIEYLKNSGFDYADNVANFLPSPVITISNLELRDYQKNAIRRWIDSSMRGCVVLPTGAGKTAVGIKAIEQVNSSALVVVPTLDLMDQWTQNLTKYLNGNNVSDENNQDISANNYWKSGWWQRKHSAYYGCNI